MKNIAIRAALAGGKIIDFKRKAFLINSEKLDPNDVRLVCVVHDV